MLKPLVTMREALTDPALLGEAIPGASWLAWRTLLIASMGEELTHGERLLFETLTGREIEPLEPVEEFWGVVGRRGGKTRAAGVLAAYVGALCDHSGYLAPGERAALPILAASVSQAMRAYTHAKGILQHSPVLSEAIDGDPTADTIRLKTKVDIEIRPANFRTIRGITAPAVICDEVAFWLIEGTANPDKEILEAVRPSLATSGGPLFVISSPHAKRGGVYEAYRRHYGLAGDPRVLVAKGPSRTFNSTLKASVVERAYERDASVAAAEYGGEFRNDVEVFVDRETVEACVARGVIERPRDPAATYQAFVDVSGGSVDSMCLAIGRGPKVATAGAYSGRAYSGPPQHVPHPDFLYGVPADGEASATPGEPGRVVVDVIRERRPPFSPEAVVEEFCTLLRSYGVRKVTGDRYGGEWPREQFRRHGIEYELADQPKSALYQGMLPLLNSGRLELLDSQRLVDQIAGLERRVARGGRESIDHAPHAHDDLANVVAGLARLSVDNSTSVPTAASSAFSWG